MPFAIIWRLIIRGDLKYRDATKFLSVVETKRVKNRERGEAVFRGAQSWSARTGESSPINSSGVAQLICFGLRMPLVKRADKINETGIGGVRSGRLRLLKGSQRAENRAREGEERRERKGIVMTKKGLRRRGAAVQEETRRLRIISEIIFRGCFDEINRSEGRSSGKGVDGDVFHQRRFKRSSPPRSFRDTLSAITFSKTSAENMERYEDVCGFNRQRFYEQPSWCDDLKKKKKWKIHQEWRFLENNLANVENVGDEFGSLRCEWWGVGTERKGSSVWGWRMSLDERNRVNFSKCSDGLGWKKERSGGCNKILIRSRLSF